MNKPIAILKDSLREAWDSKALLIMLILVGLFLVLVASVGYPAANPKTVFENHFDTLSAPILIAEHGKRTVPLIMGSDGGPPKPLAKYNVTTFKVTKEASHEPNAEYELTVLVEPTQPSKAGEADGFQTAVAMWHEDGTGKYVKIEGNRLDPEKVKVKIEAVTPDMVRTFFSEAIEARTTLPVVAVDELPSEDKQKRLFKITTGPSKEPKLWPVRFSVLFGVYESDDPAPAGGIVYLIQDVVINQLGGLMIIGIAVIITSFFIPNMLRPGAVVMLLSKPISRVTLMLFKYVGGLFFVLILATAAVGGVWLITGIRAGIWSPGVFIVIPLMTLSFAILYAVSTLAAVLTRNAIVSILVAIAFGGVLWLVGKVETFADVHRMQRDLVAKFKDEEAKYGQWAQISGIINKTLPRWHDIDKLSGKVVRESLMTEKQLEAAGEAKNKHEPTWFGTFAITLVWILGMLGISCWRFAVKDF